MHNVNINVSIGFILYFNSLHIFPIININTALIIDMEKDAIKE